MALRPGDEVGVGPVFLRFEPAGVPIPAAEAAPVYFQSAPAAPNLFDVPIFQGDPFPFFKTLRATNPVVKIGEGFWGIAKYDDVLRILRDPDTFSSKVDARSERGESES